MTVFDIFDFFDESATIWVEDHRGNYIACSNNGEGFSDRVGALHICEVPAFDDDIVLTISDF